MKGDKRMKNWVKPELYVEKFELSQHVAAGCVSKVDISITPGGSITVGIGCASTYTGKGHWHTTVDVKDEDGNGKIDWNEFTKAAGAADNGVITGQGHSNHTVTMTVPGYEISTEEKPFTS